MKRIFLVVALILLFVLSACGSSEETSSDGENNSEEKEVYKVGIDVTFPPFEYKEDDEYKGIDIDVIESIAEEEGFEIEILAMDFKNIIPSLLSGELDIGMGGMSITEERKEKVDFSNPYYDSYLTMVVSEDSDIESIEDLEDGDVISAKKGTTGGEYAEELSEDKGFESRLFDSSPDMFQEVANGNAAAFFEDEPVIAYGIKQNPDYGLKIVGEPLNDTKAGIAVKKEDSDLLEKINSGLKEIKENGKYDDIVEEHLGKD